MARKIGNRSYSRRAQKTQRSEKTNSTARFVTVAEFRELEKRVAMLEKVVFHN